MIRTRLLLLCVLALAGCYSLHGFEGNLSDDYGPYGAYYGGYGAFPYRNAWRARAQPRHEARVARHEARVVRHAVKRF